MATIVRSEAAADDIERIWLYSAAQFGPNTAQAVIRRIDATFLHLAGFPEIGRRRDDLAPGLRMQPVRGYPFVVLYRVTGDGLAIVRVLHVRRNLRRSRPG